MKNYYLLVTLFLVFTSCKEERLTASQIIEKSIQAHGANLLDDAMMEFTFRQVAYTARRTDGLFNYTRTRVVDGDTIKNVLDNKGGTFYRNDTLEQQPDSLLKKYNSSVNSVVYFAQLPYSLNGPAIHSKRIKETTIYNKDYYVVQVTFDENGGGEDHEDQFVYWINKQDFLIDYLAYSYCEQDCGFRFRESVNRRTISGITIQDYKNYKEKISDPNLTEMGTHFVNNELELLSEIELKNVSVVLY